MRIIRRVINIIKKTLPILKLLYNSNLQDRFLNDGFDTKGWGEVQLRDVDAKLNRGEGGAHEFIQLYEMLYEWIQNDKAQICELRGWTRNGERIGKFDITESRCKEESPDTG